MGEEEGNVPMENSVGTSTKDRSIQYSGLTVRGLSSAPKLVITYIQMTVYNTTYYSRPSTISEEILERR